MSDIYVDPAVKKAGDGRSWGTAITLEQALAIIKPTWVDIVLAWNPCNPWKWQPRVWVSAALKEKTDV